MRSSIRRPCVGSPVGLRPSSASMAFFGVHSSAALVELLDVRQEEVPAPAAQSLSPRRIT